MMTAGKRKTFLVTGALGCIGAWVTYHLVRRNERVVSFDLGESRHRLDLLLPAEDQRKVTFIGGDLSDFEQVAEAFGRYPVTHVIHLAALQVPFCRADPVKGASVNVVGTVNVFEAAKRAGLRHLAYASSVAVYGPPGEYPPGPVAEDAPLSPHTLYGVTKQANEGTARIYWEESGVSSTGLRPYTVYGLGRDQGITSDPTKAMLAAAASQPFEIQFANRLQLQFASDVALQFIEASCRESGGAVALNMGGEAVAMETLIEMIRGIAPTAQLAHTNTILPFLESLDDSRLRRHFERVYQTPLVEGIQQTIEAFRSHLEAGRVQFEAQD